MRKLFLLLSVAALAFVPMACTKATLQPGGAYAPTNSAGAAVSQPDIAFYRVECAFKFAHETVMTAFQIEYDNRALLWKLAPDIKKTLDSIRPNFNKAVLQYALARDAYKSNPTPANLTGMDLWLSKLKQIAVTAQTVTANLQSN